MNMQIVIVILGVAALCALYVFLWALSSSFGKTGTLWKKLPTQGFINFVTKGDDGVVTSALITSPGKKYDIETDTIIEKSFILKGLWYYISGTKWIGLTHSIGEFDFDKYNSVMMDTSTKENDIETQQTVVRTTDMPMEFDITLEAHEIETAGTVFAFFKISIHLEVRKPLKYYSLLKGKTTGNIKALILVLSVLKIYSKRRELEVIGDEDTTSETGPFQTTIMSARLKLLELTGLEITSCQLLDYGPEDDKHNEDVVTAMQRKQLEKLNGEADIEAANFRFVVAEIDLKTKKLENEGKADEIDQTVIRALKSPENFKYYSIANSGITTYVDSNANTTLAIPPSGSGGGNNRNNSRNRPNDHARKITPHTPAAAKPAASGTNETKHEHGKDEHTTHDDHAKKDDHHDAHAAPTAHH